MAFISGSEEHAYDYLKAQISSSEFFEGWHVNEYQGEVQDLHDFSIRLSHNGKSKLLYVEIKSSDAKKGVNFNGSRKGEEKQRSPFIQCAKNSDVIIFMKFDSKRKGKGYNMYVVPLRSADRPLDLLKKSSICSTHALRTFSCANMEALFSSLKNILENLPGHAPCVSDVPEEFQEVQHPHKKMKLT